MKKREWLVDSDGYLRLASNLNTCVKYIPSAERGIGLSICNPNIASSMKNAVQVTYDQSSMRLSGRVVDSGITLSFAVSEYCSPGRGDTECYIDLLDTNTPDEVLEKWSLICPNEETEVPSPAPPTKVPSSSLPSKEPSLSPTIAPSNTPSISIVPSTSSIPTTADIEISVVSTTITGSCELTQPIIDGLITGVRKALPTNFNGTITVTKGERRGNCAKLRNSSFDRQDNSQNAVEVIITTAGNQGKESVLNILNEEKQKLQTALPTGIGIGTETIREYVPSELPSVLPSDEPSILSSNKPTMSPTEKPTVSPTRTPSAMPSNQPSLLQSEEPSFLPSDEPSVLPSDEPSVLPSDEPSVLQSEEPSVLPSNEPSVLPSDEPS
eukprot:scaffold9668_cov192-Chaetoceros_neogracile.AAC.1